MQYRGLRGPRDGVDRIDPVVAAIAADHELLWQQHAASPCRVSLVYAIADGVGSGVREHRTRLRPRGRKRDEKYAPQERASAHRTCQRAQSGWSDKSVSC